MATVTALPSRSRTEHRDLAISMGRVREELAKLLSKPDADSVHDLRVAIRRCRSIAAVMEEIDPDPAWPRMRKIARKLFRQLGAYRDAQVIDDWAQKLSPATDSLRIHLHGVFESEESGLRDAVLRVAAKFNEKEWKRLQRHLTARMRFVPVGGLAAECLAFERFEEIKELHAGAMRSAKPKPWHALRIGLKRFRYTVEDLLPEHAAAWSDNLKRLQDLLGDIHDLDVLAATIKAAQPAGTAASRQAWKEKIKRERTQRVLTCRQLTLGKTSVLNQWRHALPHGERLEAAAWARVQATARASDRNPRRTALVARIALRVFDLLRCVKAAPDFSEAKNRRLLAAAAHLHASSVDRNGKSPHKAARKFLLSLPVPPSWTHEDWELLAWIVRFHRGAEPKPEGSTFSRLNEAQQQHSRVQSGVLRFARALRKAGVPGVSGFRIEDSAEALVLHIPGLSDSVETAANLAAGKHLLESALCKPLLLKAAPAASSVVTLPAPEPEPIPLRASAASAD